MSHIENGIIKVRIKYPFEDYDYVINAISRVEINKVAALWLIQTFSKKLSKKGFNMLKVQW